jgi:hypothetical protein
VNDILDLRCQPCEICRNKILPLVVINIIGFFQINLSTFLNFSKSHAFLDVGACVIWYVDSFVWNNPMWMRRNEPWGFTLTLLQCQIVNNFSFLSYAFLGHTKS